jgi:glucose/arabinose dehydrogenase
LAARLGLAALLCGCVLLVGHVPDVRAHRDAGTRLAPVRVVGGLKNPVYVTVNRREPSRLYIVEQAGRIRVARGNRLERRPFLDIRNRVRSGGLVGLFSMAFHPRYPQDPRVYVMYTGRSGDVFVVSFRTAQGRANRNSARVIFKASVGTSAYTHAGGQVMFGPDGMLYVGTGDGSRLDAPQDLETLLGKIYRLDVDGADSRPELVAYGLRQPWRFSFDRLTGDLFIGDVGGNDWEEINVLRRNASRPANFGWPTFEGRAPRHPVPLNNTAPTTAPLIAHRHQKGCRSIVGGYVYRGPNQSLRGRYVFGDLCLNAIWTARSTDGRGVRRSAINVPGGLVSFGEGARGELFAVTVYSGTVYRLDR